MASTKGMPRQRESVAHLSEEARAMLHALAETHGWKEKLAVMLGTSEQTLNEARDPHGRLRPATVERLEREIRRVAAEKAA